MSAASDPTPNLPIRVDELPDEAWLRFEKGARFASLDLPLSTLGGGTQIGVGLMVLPPGKQSCPFHYHMRDEEHFYVLAGRLVLRSGERRVEMTAGDYVCFPAGTRVAHCFENPFDAEARLLCIGANDPFEVCGYPDSDKLMVRALGRAILQGSRQVDYWQDEPVDEPLPRR